MKTDETAPFLPLLQAARQAAENAYAPYSRFRVGAALETADDRIFTGCNVENASYGLTLCAERVAVFAAVSAGCRAFKRLAIVAGRPGEPAAPCGACRQVLAEFGGPDMPVALAAPGRLDEVRVHTLGELLPHAFVLKTKK